jgi:hypothetical protein
MLWSFIRSRLFSYWNFCAIFPTETCVLFFLPKLFVLFFLPKLVCYFSYRNLCAIFPTETFVLFFLPKLVCCFSYWNLCAIFLTKLVCYFFSHSGNCQGVGRKKRWAGVGKRMLLTPQLEGKKGRKVTRSQKLYVRLRIYCENFRFSYVYVRYDTFRDVAVSLGKQYFSLFYFILHYFTLLYCVIFQKLLCTVCTF